MGERMNRYKILTRKNVQEKWKLSKVIEATDVGVAIALAEAEYISSGQVLEFFTIF
jgi:hypothetical protein